jgi:hypothetical protein
MSAIRTGETLDPSLGEETYDFAKDVLSKSKEMKREAAAREATMGGTEQFSKERLKELRRVVHERVQIGKMKAMGLEVKPSFGVRMEDVPLDPEEP